MRQRLVLAGHDPDSIAGAVSLPPLQEGPPPGTAFARAKALKRGLEVEAEQRRN